MLIMIDALLSACTRIVFISDTNKFIALLVKPFIRKRSLMRVSYSGYSFMPVTFVASCGFCLVALIDSVIEISCL